MKETVLFQTNVPVEVSLALEGAKEVGKQPVERVMYQLADGRLMLVPLSVRDQIRKLDIKPGERFEICKRAVEDEGKTSIEWMVSRNQAVKPIQTGRNGGAVPPRSVMASDNGASGSHAGNETAPKKSGQARRSYVMQMSLQGALEASKAVEKYAEESGIIDRNGDPFRFTNADIRAIGLSMFIEARKRAW